MANNLSGHPSLSKAAVALKEDGESVDEIAERLGSDPKRIRAMIDSALYRARRQKLKQAIGVDPIKQRTAQSNGAPEVGFHRFVASVAKPAAGTQFRLVSACGGLYLNVDGSGTVDTVTYAWIGTHEQAKAIKAKSAIAADMRLAAVDPWRPRDAIFAMEMGR